MDTNNVRPPKPPIPPIQPEAKIEDFVIGGVKYREIELTSDILPLFDRVDCDDIMHQNDSNSDNCRAKKNILIGLAGGYWRLFHRDAADENKLKGSVKLLSTAPAGVDMQKLASEDQGLAELELWWLRSTLRFEAAMKEVGNSKLSTDPKHRGDKPLSNVTDLEVYLEVVLTPKYAALFRNRMCNSCMPVDNKDSLACDAPKTLLIRPSSGDLRLIHSNAEGKFKFVGPWKSVLPEGVDISKLVAMASNGAEVMIEQVQKGKMAKIRKIKMPESKDEEITFSPKLEAQQQQIRSPNTLAQLNDTLLNCRGEDSSQALMSRIQHVVSTPQDAAPAMAQTPQYRATHVQPDVKVVRPSSHEPATAPDSMATKQRAETHINALPPVSGYLPKSNPPPFFSPVLPASAVGGPLPFSTYASRMPPQFPRRYRMPNGLPTPSSAVGGDSAYGQPSSAYSYHQRMMMQQLPLRSGFSTMPGQSASPPSILINGRLPHMLPQNDIWCGSPAIPGSWPSQSPSPLHTSMGATAVQSAADSYKAISVGPTQEQIDAAWTDAKTREGKTYYYNKLTRVTQWERPQQFKEPPPSSPAQKMHPVDIFRSKATGGYQAGQRYPPDLSDVKKTEAVLDKSIVADEMDTTEDMPIRTKADKTKTTNAGMMHMAQKSASEEAEKTEKARKQMLAKMRQQRELQAEKAKLPSADMAKLAKVLLQKEVTAKQEKATEDDTVGSKVEKAISAAHKKMKAERMEAPKKIGKGKELGDWEFVGEEEMDDDYVFA